MKSVRLRLPATSANLGPGFDTLALALGIFLEIEAERASEFSILASGRNADLCGGLQQNLVIDTYRGVLEAERRSVEPLALRVRNEIPLGMGCGSSAAARLAGIALADRFGNLGWNAERIVAEAAAREGHPDNVAACWYGGLAIAAGNPRPAVASISPPKGWKALLVIPEQPVATEMSRSVLPRTYAAADVIANLQNAALLTAGFALSRPDLVTRAASDRLHQPYREKLCPLLPALLPLAGQHGVLSVTLSGAGPSVLLLLRAEVDPGRIIERIVGILSGSIPTEIVEATLCGDGAHIDVTA